MANSITGNPWKLDTPGVISTSGVYIKNLVWSNAADGDLLVLLDNAGRDIIRATFETGGNNNFGQFSWVQGMNLVTLAGGQLEIVIHR